MTYYVGLECPAREREMTNLNTKRFAYQYCRQMRAHSLSPDFSEVLSILNLTMVKASKTYKGKIQGATFATYASNAFKNRMADYANQLAFEKQHFVSLDSISEEHAAYEVNFDSNLAITEMTAKCGPVEQLVASELMEPSQEILATIRELEAERKTTGMAIKRGVFSEAMQRVHGTSEHQVKKAFDLVRKLLTVSQ